MSDNREEEMEKLARAFSRLGKKASALGAYIFGWSGSGVLVDRESLYDGDVEAYRMYHIFGGEFDGGDPTSFTGEDGEEYITFEEYSGGN